MAESKENEPKTLTGLRLGRTIIYTRPEDHTPRAGVVVGVGDGSGQNAALLVFGLPQEGLFYVPLAAFDNKAAPGTWHWSD